MEPGAVEEINRSVGKGENIGTGRRHLFDGNGCRRSERRRWIDTQGGLSPAQPTDLGINIGILSGVALQLERTMAERMSQGVGLPPGTRLGRKSAPVLPGRTEPLLVRELAFYPPDGEDGRTCG